MKIRQEGRRTMATITEQPNLIETLALPTRGQVVELSSGWWRGMPGHYAHPRFDVITYRTPEGERNQRDLDFLDPGVNTVNYGFVSELVMGTMHTGTHIDALCHVTCGEVDEWHGGGKASESLGDFGALAQDAAEFPPIISRGIMIDLPRHLAIPALPANFPVDSTLLQQCLEAQNVEVRAGDVVLLRTGLMRYWPDTEAMKVAQDAGLALDGAEWLASREVIAVGADTAALEVAPSGVEGSPQPVHLCLIKDHGILIMEWVNLELLSKAEAFEFLFIGLPLTIRGATGSMLRPVAVI
jgi:kynurenine formamidase